VLGRACSLPSRLGRFGVGRVFRRGLDEVGLRGGIGLVRGGQFLVVRRVLLRRGEGVERSRGLLLRRRLGRAWRLGGALGSRWTTIVCSGLLLKRRVFDRL
jgi:hypothetical protein